MKARLSKVALSIVSMIDPRIVIDYALELVKTDAIGKFYVTDPNKAKEWLQLKMSLLEYEVFTIVFLDNQHAIIEMSEMFRGTYNQASVYPREIVKEALRLNAAAVVLAHNHPTGFNEPSEADKRLTECLQQTLKLVDVKVLDHLIVTSQERPYSFAEHGLI